MWDIMKCKSAHIALMFLTAAGLAWELRCCPSVAAEVVSMQGMSSMFDITMIKLIKVLYLLV